MTWLIMQDEQEFRKIVSIMWQTDEVNPKPLPDMDERSALLTTFWQRTRQVAPSLKKGVLL